MYEAGVAHFLATGKRSLLDICIKNADLVCKTFGPEGLKDAPGHQEIEIGLAKLYRVTGDKKYIDQAKFFLEMRGLHGDKKKGVYNQNHKPVLQQTEAVGHAVRANYMFSAMADVAALTGDTNYIAAVDILWENVVSKKLYIAGGTGASQRGESYGGNYVLPNHKAYCETCAAIANVYWNHRMFLLHGDAKYIDVMERALYNNVLAGVAFDGKHFFYPNVLGAGPGGKKRQGWYGMACCPSNLSRFMASVGGYMYAVRDESIYVNLYGQNTATIALGKRKIQVEQVTDYPWKGKVVFRVSPDKTTPFALRLRIPGWAKSQPVPSDLYTTLPGDVAKWEFSCKVNGKSVDVRTESGYAIVDRKWKAGDTLELEWPMVPQRLVSHEKVADNRGRLALQRGPIVYCVEGHDVAAEGGDVVARLGLTAKTPLRVEYRDSLLGGVTVITAEGVVGPKGKLAPDSTMAKASFFAIPYYAWSHRGPKEMAIWLREYSDADVSTHLKP